MFSIYQEKYSTTYNGILRIEAFPPRNSIKNREIYRKDWDQIQQRDLSVTLVWSVFERLHWCDDNFWIWKQVPINKSNTIMNDDRNYYASHLLLSLTQSHSIPSKHCDAIGTLSSTTLIPKYTCRKKVDIVLELSLLSYRKNPPVFIFYRVLRENIERL